MTRKAKLPSDSDHTNLVRQLGALRPLAIIRYLLTLVFVYAIYTETGKYTALAILTIAIAMEIQSVITRLVSEYFKHNNESMQNILNILKGTRKNA